MHGACHGSLGRDAVWFESQMAQLFGSGDEALHGEQEPEALTASSVVESAQPGASQ